MCKLLFTCFLFSVNIVDLLYSLYNTLNNETYISIDKFTNFIVNDVLNSEYSSEFSDKNKNDITTIDGIVNSSIDNIEFTKDEMLAILTKLSPNVNKDTISLLYMYYGTDKDYDDNYTLTIEKLVDYLNKTFPKCGTIHFVKNVYFFIYFTIFFI